MDIYFAIQLLALIVNLMATLTVLVSVIFSYLIVKMLDDYIKKYKEDKYIYTYSDSYDDREELREKIRAKKRQLKIINKLKDRLMRIKTFTKFNLKENEIKEKNRFDLDPDSNVINLISPNKNSFFVNHQLFTLTSDSEDKKKDKKLINLIDEKSPLSNLNKKCFYRGKRPKKINPNEILSPKYTWNIEYHNLTQSIMIYGDEMALKKALISLLGIYRSKNDKMLIKLCYVKYFGNDFNESNNKKNPFNLKNYCDYYDNLTDDKLKAYQTFAQLFFVFEMKIEAFDLGLCLIVDRFDLLEKTAERYRLIYSRLKFPRDNIYRIIKANNDEKLLKRILPKFVMIFK